MKKILSLFLTLALMLTLAACGSRGGQDSNSSSPAPEGDTPASTTPETPPANQRSDTTPAARRLRPFVPPPAVPWGPAPRNCRT